MFFERERFETVLDEVKPHSNIRDVMDYLTQRLDLDYPDVGGDTWMAPLYAELRRRKSESWRLTGSQLEEIEGQPTSRRVTLSFFRWRLPFGLR